MLPKFHFFYHCPNCCWLAIGETKWINCSLWINAKKTCIVHVENEQVQWSVTCTKCNSLIRDAENVVPKKVICEFKTYIMGQNNSDNECGKGHECDTIFPTLPSRKKNEVSASSTTVPTILCDQCKWISAEFMNSCDKCNKFYCVKCSNNDFWCLKCNKWLCSNCCEGEFISIDLDRNGLCLQCELLKNDLIKTI